jgi:histone-lysine N-methyltransferase SETMAR
MLQAQLTRSWRDIVAVDEFWFYLNTDSEWTWLAPGEDWPNRERHTIQSPKFMLTIVWGVIGFHVVKLPPKGGTVKASDYIDEIISQIPSWREAQGGTINRRLVVHADNARPETAGSTLRYIKSCGMVRAPHPPYSPDLAPSDFFFYLVISKACFGDDISRLAPTF